MNEYSDFILCYRKPHGLNWDCEMGYKSVVEVDERTTELLKHDKHLTTTFFPTRYYVPVVFRQMIISSALSPKITMYNKPSSSNGERGGPIMSPRSVMHQDSGQIPRPKNAYY